MLVGNVYCSDANTGQHFCNGISLGCAYARERFRVVGTSIKETEFYSGKSLEILCPSSYFMQGVTCRGRFCIEMKLKCVLVETNRDRAPIRNATIGEKCDLTQNLCRSGLSCKDWTWRDMLRDGMVDQFCDADNPCAKDMVCDFGRCRIALELTFFEDVSSGMGMLSSTSAFSYIGLGSS